MRPPPYDTSPRALAADTTIEIFTGGGPGGQHRNKTQNAVRLYHEPSDVLVTATERRSLEANRKAAFERLVARLDKLNEVKKPRKKTRPSRGAVKRRLESKTATSRTKAARRPVRDD